MTTVEQPAKPQNPWGPQGDTGSAKAAKPKVRLPLDTTRDCAKALAKLVRRSLAGDLTTADLSRYANALMILSRIIEGGAIADLNERLDALEQRGFH